MNRKPVQTYRFATIILLINSSHLKDDNVQFRHPVDPGIEKVFAWMDVILIPPEA